MYTFGKFSNTANTQYISWNYNTKHNCVIHLLFINVFLISFDNEMILSNFIRISREARRGLMRGQDHETNRFDVCYSHCSHIYAYYYSVYVLIKS